MSANIEQIKAMLEHTGKTNLLQKQKVDLDKERLQLEATVNKEPVSDDLEEAAEKYEYEKGHLYHPSIKEIFIAGAEWQKEQDQPITGNSLEQEWLRYVDKKKKEYGGELPSLGEYGWLQIARHFAEWQKAQMMKEAVEASVNTYELAPGGSAYVEFVADMPVARFRSNDKVRILVLEEKEE